MKKWLIIFCGFILLLTAYGVASLFFKQNISAELQSDRARISIYNKWGLETNSFETMYSRFEKEVNAIPLPTFLFRTKYIKNKHDSILLLVQASYATEISKQRSLVQTRLSYLRERLKNTSVLSQTKKQTISDSFEVIAGNVFETNGDINALKEALIRLDAQDIVLTNEMEAVRKESLFSELNGYKTTCSNLSNFFIEMKSSGNQSLAQQCIDAADKLMGPGYLTNGAEFMEALSRERVFTALKNAEQAKLQLIQEQQYAQAVTAKNSEQIALVPPAPLQEGKVVVVNLALQRLFAYENGVSIFSEAVPITTGKYGFETVTGEFAIYLKEQQHKMVSPFPGIYYDDVVNYWMPFYLGYGLHDAPWRAVYGTLDYPVVGSHGCVNMPLNSTIVLYNWAEVGTKVIVL